MYSQLVYLRVERKERLSTKVHCSVKIALKYARVHIVCFVGSEKDKVRKVENPIKNRFKNNYPDALAFR